MRIRATASLLAALLACAAAAAPAARAQPWSGKPWPDKPVRIIVPFAPGGAIDVMARLLAGRMQEALKSSVIVENRPGAGGILGMDYAARQPADGHALLYNTNGQAIAPAVYKSLPFDPLRDFIPVTQLFASNLLLAASPKTSVSDLRGLIALAKDKRGALNYGSSGVGNPLHLTMELLKLRTGMDMRMVPYRSDGEIVNALLGNSVEAAVLPVVTAKEHVLAGTLRGLGVTAARRARGLDVPTLAEQGLDDFDAGGWQGLFAPAGTPAPVVRRIAAEVKKAFEAPEMQARVDAFALDNVFSGPGQFLDFYESEVENFRRIVREAKIPLQE